MTAAMRWRRSSSPWIEQPAASVQKGISNDPFFLSPHSQSGEGRALPRGVWPSLRNGSRRHQQGRATPTLVQEREPERQGAGHRRHGGLRRRDPGVRFERNPAVSCREDRPVPRLAGRPARAALVAFLPRTGLGPFSEQAVHFQYAAPEGLDYAVNRYRREAERHYEVLDHHLAGRDYIVGSDYTIVDMFAWVGSIVRPA